MTQLVSQDWKDKAYCREYAETWEISTDEVHYGWLTDGEKRLRLFGDMDLQGAKVLDVGCGMGENLMALAKQGASCFGVDISPHMLEDRIELVYVAFVRGADSRRARVKNSSQPELFPMPLSDFETRRKVKKS